jgi:hypothetical protein
MVRLALLIVLAVTLCVAAPASANPLTQGVTATATGTVQQATTTVDSVVADASAALPAQAQPAVVDVEETARVATQSATRSVAVAAAPTQPRTAAPATTSAASPKVPDASPKALSSTRDRGQARVLRAGRDRAAEVGRPESRPPAPMVDAPRPAERSAAPVAHDDRPAAGPERDDQQAPSFLPASGGASAASGLSFAGAALLAGLFCLCGPRLVRRLPTVPATARPAAFALSLERPG